MSQLFYGSLDVTTILAEAKKKHSAFVKADNGKIYMNINIWINDELDKFGNKISIQLNSTKEKRETEGKIYIGNAKESERKDPQPISDNDLNAINTSDLPF